MRMTHVDFLERLQLIEPDIKPLLCFRLRLGVSSITISPFSTTFTKAYSLFTIFEHWTSDVSKQDVVSMDTSRWASVVHGTHARAQHVWYGCPNEYNIAHQTREQKKCFKLFDLTFEPDMIQKLNFLSVKQLMTVVSNDSKSLAKIPEDKIFEQNIWTVNWQVEILQLSTVV